MNMYSHRAGGLLFELQQLNLAELDFGLFNAAAFPRTEREVTTAMFRVRGAG